MCVYVCMHAYMYVYACTCLLVCVYMFDEKGRDGRQIKEDRLVGRSCSTACFLAQHGHDFHRWITKGVSYTTADVEAKLSTALPPPMLQSQELTRVLTVCLKGLGDGERFSKSSQTKQVMIRVGYISFYVMGV